MVGGLIEMKFEIYRNKEIRMTLCNVILFQIILAVLFLILLYSKLNSIEVKYKNVNIALYGRIVYSNPGLIGEIEDVFTKRVEDKDLKYGGDILRKYGYSAGDDSKSEYAYTHVRQTLIDFILYTIASIIILVILISRRYRLLFDSLRNISDIVCKNFDGNYIRIPEIHEDGEMSILINSINELLHRLKASIDLLKKEKVFLKDVISDISHQLKTPLASLIMFNEYILQDIETPKEILQDCLESSSDQLKRMEWLILNLLKMARLEAGAISFTKEKSSIKQTVEKSVEAFYLVAKEKNQKITIICDEDDLFPHDIEWTIEALSNIIKNAIEHTGNNGEINIYIDITPISVHIEIEDNGEGITKEELGKIFERFYKGKNSANPNSIGIGLALSKVIIENQGGDIRVDSEVGVGTKFYVSLIKGII